MLFLRFFALGLLGLLLAACSDPAERPPRMLGTATACDAAIAPCEISHEGIVLTLNLAPPVKPLLPFATTLAIAGTTVDPHSVVIDFQMVGMDMGSNRYRLLPEGGAWKGTVTLPVCTASRMDWFAEVEFTAGKERYLARFPLHTEAN